MEYDAWLDAPPERSIGVHAAVPGGVAGGGGGTGAGAGEAGAVVRRDACVQNGRMPRDYLQKIEHAAFPLRVEDPSEVGCVQVLRVAGLVDAAVTPSDDAGKPFELAVVVRITVKGRDELERLRLTCPLPPYQWGGSPG